MAVYQPSRVYGNLLKMAECRGLTVIGDIPAREDVAKVLTTNEYAAVYAAREETPNRAEVTTAIILIATDSEFATTVGRFKSLCATIKTPEMLGRSSDSNFNVVLCASNVVTSHIAREIDRLRVEGWGEGSRIVHPRRLRIEYYTHKGFAIDATHHHMVSPHRILTPAETQKFFARHATVPKMMPRINDTDPQAIYLGLLPGQCVEITRASEVSGESIMIRVCVAAAAQQKK